MVCGSSSFWAKIALAAIIIAMILDIVGVATINWMVYQISTNSIKVGLFQMKSCAGYACTSSAVGDGLKDGTFSAAQAFEVLALVLMILGAILVAVYVFVQSSRGKCMAILACGVCLSAALFAFVGMICWISYVTDPYVVSWSLGLTVLAAILACIAGMLLIPDILDGNYGKGGHYPLRPTQVAPPSKRFMY